MPLSLSSAFAVYDDEGERGPVEGPDLPPVADEGGDAGGFDLFDGGDQGAGQPAAQAAPAADEPGEAPWGAADAAAATVPEPVDSEALDAGETPGETAPASDPDTAGASAAEPRNAQGLAASAVRAQLHAPMVDASWMRFEGDHVAVHGYCLPPDGDPGSVRLALGPGVKGSLTYPLERPDVAEHYWYWPNAQASGFIVRIELAASAPGSDPFVFDFARRSPTGEETGLANGRVWIPSDLTPFVGFPQDPDQLSRVQHYSDPQTVGLTGFNAFRRLEAALARHGVKPRPGLRLLDWGCGHGRVTRHFLRAWPGIEAHGIDIDPQNIRWAAEALPAGSFATTGLWPPAPLESASVDVVVGLSVMTHLTAAAQAAWLWELARVLKPGGLAVLTFAGATAVAYSSRWRDPQWWARWTQGGFDDTQPDPAVAAPGAPDYYRNTYQTEADVRARWSGPFEVLEITPDQFGYQDAAVLRRR